MLEKAQVHMLPSTDWNRVGKICAYEKHEISYKIKDYKSPVGIILLGIKDSNTGMTAFTLTNEGIYWNGELFPQDLYFTTDEEIIGGGPVLFFKDGIANSIIPKSYKPDADYDRTILKKIVATTNPELWYKGEKHDNGLCTNIWGGGIPKIGEDFVDAYVKAQSSITEVMLECRRVSLSNDKKILQSIEYPVRISSDGCIIWSPVEERTYTKRNFGN